MAKDRDPNKRAVRDLAGVGPEPRETRHLAPMKELKKFRLVSGDPDIRGWSVFTSNGREVGRIEDLLVDTSRGEVVMIDIDLRDSERHSLAPLRAAWVDRDAKRVVLDGAQFDAEEEIPSLRRGAVSDEEARSFSDGYVRAYGEQGFAGEDEYRIRGDESDIRFGRRSTDREERSDHDYMVERQPVADRSRRLEPDDDSADWRDVGYVSRERDEEHPPRPVVVEETVVRRRVVDESELSDDLPSERRSSPPDNERREDRR